MKVRRHLARLEPMVLSPIRGISQQEWHEAPRGRWSVAQIVHHLALSVDLVAKAFERRADRTDMRRRANPYQTLGRHLMLGVGAIPRGLKAPDVARPDERPDPELIVAEFRIGVEQLTHFADSWPESRQVALFVRHPVVGDLNLPEWCRFHYLHCRHHARQLVGRLDWVRERKA